MSRRAPLTDAARLAGWAVLMAPLGLFLHELGHFLAGRLLGFDDVRVGVAGVSGGARLGETADRMVAIQAGAGPAVTLLLLILAWAFVARSPRHLWAVALAATAPLRFLVGAVFIGARLLTWLQGGVPGVPNFDEYNLAKALGISPLPLAAVGAILLFGSWAWLWRRLPRGRRALTAAALAAGTAGGLFLWMGLVGPPLVALINRA